MKQWLIAVFGAVSISTFGASITQNEAVERAKTWMTGNPVMSKASQTVASVQTFPDTGSYSVYVVQLSPKGFLILNSDDRLPMLVSFSAESTVNLSDDPQNALRGMLLGYCAQKAEELENWISVPLGMVAMVKAVTGDELYGPFLETSWNQNSPYNLLCPVDGSSTSDSYEGRAPVGCVPTTFAQLMNYHRWPYYGSGSRSYTDSSGSTTGSHSADFSDAYDWGNMQAVHSSSDPQVNQDAVAELMYELGVATEVNYEASGTSGSTPGLGNKLGEYFYFESIEEHDSQLELIVPMEAELRGGFPCIVSYPGHAFIADGLMVDGGVTTYHFNLGWGGSNNGWWDKSAIPTSSGDKSLDGGVTSLRPQLIAFPLTNSVPGDAGDSAEVKWILPKRRESEVSRLTIKQLVQQSENWSSDASEITGLNAGWKVVSAGRSGDCWFTGPNDNAALVLKEIFVPDISTQLTFWRVAQLYISTFSVQVSVDGGATYSTLSSTPSDIYENSWSQQTISLGAYAGQNVQIKFLLSESGGAYGGTWAGVRIDDLAVTSGDWYDWTTFAEDTTLASRRFSEVSTVWDDCDDFSVFEETLSDPDADWVVSTTEGVDDCFYKAAPSAWNYGCHLTSRSTITPSSSTRLLVRAKYGLASSGNPEYFKILVSDDRSRFTEIWSANGSADWADIVLDLSAYAGESIYVRLAYEFSGSYQPGGGIWIDSISTQEVTNSELEGQPIHYTMLSNLPAGTHTLAAVLTDTNSVEHAVGPAFTLSVSGAADDGDGMPSDWETMYGLNPSVDDGGLDPDGDGFSNWKEYISGTVPTNSSSVWKLSMGSGSLPAFQGLDNRLYTIEYCDGLSSNAWKTLSSGIVGSNGLFEVNSFESITNACRFYRVKVRELH